MRCSRGEENAAGWLAVWARQARWWNCSSARRLWRSRRTSDSIKGRRSEERPDTEEGDEAPRFSATESVGMSMATDYRGTVLVVDDDHAALDTAVVLLESFGYKALTARSDDDALAMIRRQSVDILLTDIVSGITVDGPELARLARQINPAIAVVYTTRYSPMFLLDSEAPRDGLLLRKPWQREELGAVLAKSTQHGRP